MRILIVEPELHGHKAFYLALILKAFDTHQLTVLTQPNHQALTAQINRQSIDRDAVEWISVDNRKPTEVYAQCSELFAKQSFDRIFITYLDHYLPLMASKANDFGCHVHGIWFHPHALDRKYNWLLPIDKRIKQRRTLHRWIRNEADNSIERIYFLDPEAPKRLKTLNQKISASYLPDPGERPPKLSQVEARAHFKLPQDRTIFLHAGSPEKRKGLPDLIDAFYRLSKNTEWREKSLLLRIGPDDRLSKQSAQKLEKLIQRGCAQATDQFVSEEDFIEYFSAADCIVLPYRKFRYSSGILANAIIAQRPVICSDYGLIAKAVKGNELGQTYKHGSREALAQALVAFDVTSVNVAPINRENFLQALI